MDKLNSEQIENEERYKAKCQCHMNMKLLKTAWFVHDRAIQAWTFTSFISELSGKFHPWFWRFHLKTLQTKNWLKLVFVQYFNSRQ